MVDPIIGTKWLTKVLMDGGSGLNIMYAEMLMPWASTDRVFNRPGHLSMASCLESRL